MGVKAIPVNEYVEKILQGRDHITSKEMQIDGDFDYVMLMMVTMEYDSKESPYCMEFEEGQVKVGGYGIPNMTISRR